MDSPELVDPVDAGRDSTESSDEHVPTPPPVLPRKRPNAALPAIPSEEAQDGE